MRILIFSLLMLGALRIPAAVVEVPLEQVSRLCAEMYTQPPYTLDFQTSNGKRIRAELLPKVLCE